MIRISMLPFRWRPAHFLRDRRGIAATEFAMIAPFMLVAFFGTVEFCSAVAIDRKVTLIARTLSDLTSQQTPPSITVNWATIADSDLQNIFTASISIMASYDATPTQASITEVYVDKNGKATVQWSKSAVIAAGATQATLTASTTPLTPGNDVSNIVASEILVPQTYVIFSQVSYKYVPTIGYVLKTGVNMKDNSYTRPRQSACIVYNNVPNVSTNGGNCPQS
ncbi:MAG TPA: TadE/TadG family type IV pilus assembly protein [Bradyrhizobium sp.]|nr:TadE/TadG family type IV pilus assembly protein [Bradyrhizobium sp.]